MKHRFPEKRAADCDPVETADEFVGRPSFDGVRMAELVQLRVAGDDFVIDPGIVLAAQAWITSAKRVSIRISIACARRSRFSPCGIWKVSSGRIARGSGENHRISPSSIAIGKTPSR
jgi:hypothetical protein